MILNNLDEEIQDITQRCKNYLHCSTISVWNYYN
jgi:hypothetical protein